MQEYFLACLLFPQANVSKMQKQIAKSIGELKGKVLFQDNHEQSLASPIKKQVQAELIKTFFALDVNQILKLKKNLNHETEILRFLLVKFPYTKVKLGDEAKMERVKRQTKKIEAKGAVSKIKTAKKKVAKKVKKDGKKEKLDKALAKILKE